MTRPRMTRRLGLVYGALCCLVFLADFVYLIGFVGDVVVPSPSIVRQPLMLGFVIAFWSIPTMTAGHLLLSKAMTVYILAV